MPIPDPLANPIWSALNSEHGGLALGNGLARRYPAEIGPLCGVADQSDASYEALRTLAGPSGIIVLFLEEPPISRPGWTLIRGGSLSQMMREQRTGVVPARHIQAGTTRPLTRSDVPAMVELAELTEPGPFRNRTIELGAFFGIFEGDRLLAMAGERLHLPHFVEVSAVCTHPDARGRGFARSLMSLVINEIEQRGKTAFLHVLSDNHSAIRVYEGLGFTLRRTFHLAVLKNET